jgi:DNA processing protein
VYSLTLPGLEAPILASRALDLSRRRIAIVGSRACTEEAAAFARSLAGAIVKAGAVVVSGGAVGIDAAAHDGALAANGETWAVLPRGPEQTFPKESEERFNHINSTGVLIWAFAEGTASRARFLKRNGVLVALSEQVVVVQASERSGSLNTARHAHNQSKAVYISCGPPWDSRFNGCHSELSRGARPIASLDTLLEELGLAGPSAREPQGLPWRNTPPETDSFLRLFAHGPMHIDDIVEQTPLSVGQIQAQLTTWTIAGRLVCGNSGHYSLKRP